MGGGEKLSAPSDEIGVRAVSEACSRESRRGLGVKKHRPKAVAGWVGSWDGIWILVEVWGLGLGARDDMRKGRRRVSGRVRLGC
eukprot:scaffold32027_cov62-Phaeocystis_antarctica.AAC.2